MRIKDDFLEKYSQSYRNHLLSAFVDMCRRKKYGKTSKSIITGGTIKSTVSNICLDFRKNLRPYPAFDLDMHPSLFLTHQLMGYINSNSSAKQQKALPPSVFRTMLQNTFTPMDEAMGQLSNGAFFFAMRSCEFLIFQGKRKTKRLNITNCESIVQAKLTENHSNSQTLTDTQTCSHAFRKVQKTRRRNIYI